MKNNLFSIKMIKSCRLVTITQKLLTLFMLATLCFFGNGSAWGQKTYELVTNSSQLVAGKNYIFAGKKATNVWWIGTYNSSMTTYVYATSTGITNVSAPTTFNVTAMEFTLAQVATGNTWGLYSADAGMYLTSGTTGSNGSGLAISLGTTDAVASTWYITIADTGATTIVSNQNAISSSNRVSLQFNATTGDERFSCYGTSQQPIYLYVEKISSCTTPPSTPTAGTHIPTNNQITWKWLAPTSGDAATGYRYNTVNDSTIIGGAVKTTSLQYLQSGLEVATAYTLYVWAENDCGVSANPVVLSETTLCNDATITWVGSSSSGTFEMGKAATPRTAITASTGAVVYSITSGDAASINATTGELTFLKDGAITVQAEVAAHGEYCAANNSYNYTINCGSPFNFSSITASALFSTNTYTRTVGNFNIGVDASMLTYSSSNTAVATVNATTGEVTFVTTGTVIISATPTGSLPIGYCTTPKTYTLTIVADPPVNDLCDNAIELSCGTPLAGTLEGATFTTGSGGLGSYPDVWYKFTPATTDTYTIIITDFKTSTENIDIHVYNTCIETFPLFYGDGITETETLETTVIAGTTYYIRVMDVNEDASTFTISLTCPCPAIAPPTAVVTSDLTCTSFKANWTGSASDYELYVYMKEIAEPQELVINGDFETGNISPWTSSSSGQNVLTVENGIGHSSSMYAKYNTSGSNTQRLEQDIAVVSGKTYTFSFWYNNYTKSGNGIKNYTIQGTSGSNYISNQDALESASTWTKYEQTFTATTDIVRISIRAYVACSIDDVSLIATTGEEINVPYTGFNPKIVSSTSQEVTGLDPVTTYYYILKAKGTGLCASQVSPASDIITVLTLDCYCPKDTTIRPITICSNKTYGDADFASYSIAGTYYSPIYPNKNGCDSVVKLVLTVYPISEKTVVVSACESYTYGLGSTELEQTYTTSGTHTHTFTAANGCDSVVTLNLTINQPVTKSISHTACESYTYGAGSTELEQTYTTSGIYTHTFLATNGCDSVVTLNLTINQTYSNSITEAACGSYTYGAGSIEGIQTYTTSGTYTHTFLATNGCDSVVTLNLTITPLPVAPTAVVTSDLTCTSFKANWTGSASDYELYVYTHESTSATIFNEDFTGLAGNNSTTGGSGSAWSGNANFSASTAYQAGNAVRLGSNSNTGYIETKDLDLSQNFTLSFDVKGWTTVEGDIIVTVGTQSQTIGYTAKMEDPFETKTVSFSGSTATKVKIATSARRAFIDNVSIETELTINVPYTGFNPKIVSSTSQEVTGLDPVTTYYYILKAKGTGLCASQVSPASDIITVTTLDCYCPKDTTIRPITICSNKTYGDADFASYSIAGTYYSPIYPNKNGCDSVVKLVLTVNPISEKTVVVSACESYTYGLGSTELEQTYTTSGTHTHTFTAANGCDSVVTLNLTINQPVTKSISHTACESYTYGAGSTELVQTYTTSGTYTHTFTATNGCDSVVTLNLTINQPVTKSISQTACDFYTYGAGSDEGIQTYTTSGIYTHTFTATNGCDSVVTLNFTLIDKYETEFSVTTSGSYTWDGTIYTASNSYVKSYITSNGCDSIVTLKLIVTPTIGIPCGVALDAEGNYYYGILINGVCWLNSNLRTQKDSLGNPITSYVYVSDEYPDELNNEIEYGRLYDFATAQQVCPPGWRLPTVVEANSLIVGGVDDLKAVGAGYWRDDPAVTNASGLTIRPAGFYDVASGSGYLLKLFGYFWTSELSTSTTSKACNFITGCPESYIIDYKKINGISVRCVKK